MNYVKIQNDVIKAKFAQDSKGKDFRMMYGYNDEGTLGIINQSGTAIFLIPEKFRYIDAEKIFKEKEPIKNIGDFFPKERDLEDAIDTKNYVISVNGKMLKVLQGKKEKICISDDLLKDFKAVNPTFRSEGTSKSPVLVYEDEVLLGMLLPVRFNFEN